jgi:hypothetical protein
MGRSPPSIADSARYAKCIEVSRRVRWDIDKDVIRGRDFDFSEKFLPDSISGIDKLDFLGREDKTLLSQIQGRTYANMFRLVERFICAKIIDVSRGHFFGDQLALESLVRFSDEELKHQELFRRIETMIGARMPAGYRFVTDPNDFARAVLAKQSWTVLALIFHIELFTQSHYRESIAPDTNVSALFKDVFLYHWREESQHAIMDEMEWKREDSQLTDEERDQAIDDFIDLIAQLDSVLRKQSDADVGYFLDHCNCDLSGENIRRLRESVLAAYRWQYIESGITHQRFRTILYGLIRPVQAEHIQSTLATVLPRSGNHCVAGKPGRSDQPGRPIH